MYKIILGLLISGNAWGMITFDAENFRQNVQNYRTHLESLHQLKQQIEYQKDNMQKLNVNTVKDLYNNTQKIKGTLDGISGVHDTLIDLDKRYGGVFTKDAKQLPDDEQNFLMRQHLKQNIATNKRSMNALKILQSQQQDQQKTQELINKSQAAAGQMQALQSSNQLAAIQIKQLQDLKLLMSQDLEQRTAAVAEENTARVIAHQRFQAEMAKPKTSYRNIKLPKLK